MTNATVGSTDTQSTRTRATFERAKRVMPLGVTSNFRYTGDTTLVIKRGDGPYVWDMDDRQYLDYRLAYGPVILGHNHPGVVKRITEQLQHGNLYAHTHPLEIEVAERIVAMHPSVDKIRYANSGTEATMHAVRLARAFTNREKIVKFEGAYHGNHDYALYSTANMPHNGGGSPRSPIPVPQSSGIPIQTRELIYITRYNAFEHIERLVKDRGHEIAALLVEPVMGNAVCLLPEPGYLEHLRALCDKAGILLIFDEVKTGFRIAPGGAAEHFGVRADITTFAKALGNGYPIAAIGGRAEVMDTIAMAQVVQGGTYCGHALGGAAAMGVLDAIEHDHALDVIRERGQRLMAGMHEILTEQGIAHEMSGLPSMFGIIFAPRTPKAREFRDVMNGSFQMYTDMAYELRARGIDVEPDAREPMFVSSAHTEADIDNTLDRFNDAIKACRPRWLH
ncbi:MAG TPA: aspartate aminotransferase family protein [Anaerolineales bacterium]|nr:aspartate aminotransferase family protein [Anaerolineales bacterium]